MLRGHFCVFQHPGQTANVLMRAAKPDIADAFVKEGPKSDSLVTDSPFANLTDVTLQIWRTRLPLPERVLLLSNTFFVHFIRTFLTCVFVKSPCLNNVNPISTLFSADRNRIFLINKIIPGSWNCRQSFESDVYNCLLICMWVHTFRMCILFSYVPTRCGLWLKIYLLSYPYFYFCIHIAYIASLHCTPSFSKISFQLMF